MAVRWPPLQIHKAICQSALHLGAFRTKTWAAVGWAPRLDNTCCILDVEASFNLYAPHVEHLLLYHLVPHNSLVKIFGSTPLSPWEVCH
jgi:hypothetical protein